MYWLPRLIPVLIVLEYLRRAVLRRMRAVTTTEVVPLHGPTLNTTVPAASESAASAQASSGITALFMQNPAANTTAPGSTAQNAFVNCYAAIRQHIQQWLQGPIHYWQTLKNAVTAKIQRLIYGQQI
jgi:hypothetical protein